MELSCLCAYVVILTAAMMWLALSCCYFTLPRLYPVGLAINGSGTAWLSYMVQSPWKHETECVYTWYSNINNLLYIVNVNENSRNVLTSGKWLWLYKANVYVTHCPLPAIVLEFYQQSCLHWSVNNSLWILLTHLYLPCRVIRCNTLGGTSTVQYAVE